MTSPDGPVDPFQDDPNDPAALLGDQDEYAPVPLTEAERADVQADLAELIEFRATLAPHGVLGVVVDCSDCSESHYFGWDLMTANLQALLADGVTHAHEPAFQPDPDRYVTWDYARGFTDALRNPARHSSTLRPGS
jgi:hypothetical protein